MAKVSILVVGWTNEDCQKEGRPETTAATISLIRDHENLIIVDPGELPDQRVLLDALKNESLSPANITHIFQTHYHIDHTRNTGLFPEKVKIINEFGIWHEGKDEEIEFPFRFSQEIEIISTPGHSHDALTVLVKIDKGVAAICGDVFWKENFPTEDPYANNMRELKKSRQKVIGLSDYIIPGHGDIYEVKK